MKLATGRLSLWDWHKSSILVHFSSATWQIACSCVGGQAILCLASHEWHL